MKIYLNNEEKTKKEVLQLLEKDNILAKFKTPLNAYVLLLAAACYNISNIILTSNYYELKYILLLFVREMAAASIGVYGLARLYYMFVDNPLKRMLWYFLVVVAAFNFNYFVEFASNWLRVTLNLNN